MSHRRDDRQLPSDGDVAYFVKLHLDTVECTGPHSTRTDHCCYRVDGKARPMIVIRRIERRRRGRTWFVVLELTTKGLSENGEVMDGYMSIGRAVDRDRDSFVGLKPDELPENMLSFKDGRAAVGRMDQLVQEHIFNVLERRIRSHSLKAVRQ